jgi:hypothetical protein
LLLWLHFDFATNHECIPGLQQGKLISPEASKTMREIFASADIPHDRIKFVKALSDRNVQIIRAMGLLGCWAAALWHEL